jgi:hypothetical protein
MASMPGWNGFLSKPTLPRKNEVRQNETKVVRKLDLRSFCMVSKVLPPTRWRFRNLNGRARVPAKSRPS